MIKRTVIMLVLVGAVFAGLYWFVDFRAKMIKGYLATLSDPVQTVGTTTAAVQDWQPSLSVIGTFRAVKGADLALQVPGIVEKIHFESGDLVKEGQDLLDLRKDEDIAKLDSLKATADLNAIVLHRDEEQLKVKAISQATLDTDLANQKNIQAQVAQQQAIIAQKSLQAPFAGRLGIRSVDVGQYLSAGTAIVTLQALDSVYLDFVMPQQAIAAVKVGQTIRAHVDAFPGTDFVGHIIAINAKVDSASRNVQVRAQFENPDSKLLPGMYATAQINIGAAEHYVTLPQTAVIYNPYGNSVFFAEPKGANGQLVAREVFIETGQTRGDEVAILSGIEPGTTVVTIGQNKLRNGTKLKVDNSVTPKAEANPQPVDK